MDATIFDYHLPDSYIHALSAKDTQTLIDEALERKNELEHEIDEIMWKDDSRFNPDGTFKAIEPSRYSYDPILYADEIEEDPTLLDKLETAKAICEKVALLLAVLGSARLHKARLIDIDSKVESGQLMGDEDQWHL